MFEIISLVLFCWLFVLALRLFFRIAWGAAKVVAVILFILALPTLACCLIFAGGLLLLLPIALIAAAWGLLKLCT